MWTEHVDTGKWEGGIQVSTQGTRVRLVSHESAECQTTDVFMTIAQAELLVSILNRAIAELKNVPQPPVLPVDEIENPG